MLFVSLLVWSCDFPLACWCVGLDWLVFMFCEMLFLTNLDWAQWDSSALCVVSWAAIIWWHSWAETSKMVHSDDDQPRAQLGAVNWDAVVFCTCLSTWLSRRSVACVQKHKLLKLNLGDCMGHFCLIYWSKQVTGPVHIQQKERLWLFMARTAYTGREWIVGGHFRSLFTNNGCYTSLPRWGYWSWKI